MTTTYCPKRNKDSACSTCHNGSWGSAQRVMRFALAVATLDAMGGVQAGRFRCVADGKWYAIGSQPMEVDRPTGGTCYVLGNMVATREAANQARNNVAQDPAWTARYVEAARVAGARVQALTGAQALAVWQEWHPTPTVEAVEFVEAWF